MTMRSLKDTTPSPYAAVRSTGPSKGTRSPPLCTYKWEVGWEGGVGDNCNLLAQRFKMHATTWSVTLHATHRIPHT
jgi:hypothetical protein